MISEPNFYLAAVPAIALAGLSKGGFGGAFGFAAVPLMALVISPVQAAGLMLPILLIMDAVAVTAYRRSFDRGLVLQLLPAGVAGTALGWATATLVSDDAIRLLVGLIALAFLARVALARWGRSATAAPAPDRQPAAPAAPGLLSARVWGTLAGYTSFVAHAGGPPFQAHVVPLRLDPVTYAATSAVFFAIINAAKVIPYAALGQFGSENLTTAAVLAPLAIASTWGGVRLVRIIPEALFYRILIVSISIVGVKLVQDGLAGLL